MSKVCCICQGVTLGSALLGTAYSAPPLRLKRFPLLAALSIIVVSPSSPSRPHTPVAYGIIHQQLKASYTSSLRPHALVAKGFMPSSID